jgi:hypothetical protein
MKQIIIVCFCALWLFSCSHKVQQQQQPYSAQVTFLNKDETGTITVNSKGFGKDQNSAILNAQSNAFNIIFFKGIPGTDLNVPLIENENDAKTKYPEYFNKFFDQGNYQSFLMSSTLSEDPAKSKGGVYCSVDLKINYNSLRKDLEQNNIIRKFGF